MTKTGLQTMSPVRKQKDMFIITSNKEMLDKLGNFYTATGHHDHGRYHAEKCRSDNVKMV
jgi:hypothetical protein